MDVRKGRWLVRGALAVAACLTVLAWQTVGAADVPDAEELVLLNWPDYLEPGTAALFEAETGTRIAQVHYESDTGRNALVALNNARGFDIAVVDGASLALYRKSGWLAPIRHRQVPNLTHIDYRWQGAFPAAEGYAVPYFWGTMGIAYNRDGIEDPPLEWIDLFRPSADLCGSIVMPSDVRELVGLALRALGHPENGASAEQLEDARRLLLEQRPCVAEYGYVNLGDNSELISGEILATVLYSGDALMLHEVDQAVAFQVPASGSTLWIDYLVVFASSKKQDLAYRLIDFLNRPDIAAQQAAHLRFATPNRPARELLDEGYRKDPTIYPPPDVIEVSDFHRTLTVRELRSFNSIYASVVNRPGKTQ